METDTPLLRVGGDDDGGYLVPDDFGGIVACFSPGVDVVATFEQAMVARGIRCFQVDASVASSPIKHPLVQFERLYLGSSCNDQTITLDRWVEQSMDDMPGDLILQMDIEGAEWLAWASVSDETLARFRIMVIEFIIWRRY